MLSRGFAVRLQVHGEPLTFRGEQVTGSINLAVQDDTAIGTAPELSARREAEIEIQPVTPEPRHGEYLTAADGTRYRIKRVTSRTAYSVVVRCEPIPPSA